jgi:hypothetical protein
MEHTMTLNQRINEYTNLVRRGDIRTAYQEILGFMGRLRVDFGKRSRDCTVGSIYQGYMDMTYFSLSTPAIKDMGLRIAIVYLHEKGTFEAWLSARNREISKRYGFLLVSGFPPDLEVVHDRDNLDAIIECTVSSAPDFENQISLMEEIESKVDCFIAAVSGLLLVRGRHAPLDS